MAASSVHLAEAAPPIVDSSKLELRGPSSTQDSSVACQVGLHYGSNGCSVLGHRYAAAARTCRSSDAHRPPGRCA